MSSTSIIGLINNAALLLALYMVYDIIGNRTLSGTPPIQQFITGIILSAIGIAIMLNPWEFKPGVIFDTRSVLLSISGLFFGTIPTVLAMIVTGVFRFNIGGGGTWTGIAVIVTSGGIGLAWRRLRINREQGEQNLSKMDFYLLGVTVHVAMLLWMLSLPWPVAMGVLSNISLPVMLIFPVTTTLLGWLMVNSGKKKRTEEALRESKDRYQGIFDESIAAIYLFDDQKKFLDSNKAGLELLGYSKEELLKMSIPEVYFEPKIIIPMHEQVIGGQRLTNYEHKLRRKDQGVVTVLNNSKPITSADGNVIGIQSTLIDITERRHAEHKLQESEQRFRELFDNMGSGVAIYESRDNGQSFIFKDMNKAGLEYSQKRKDDIIGREVREIFPGIKELGLFDIFRCVWKTGEPEHHHSKMYKDKDITLWVENYVCKLPSGELVAIYEDTTEKRKAEEAKEKLEMQLMQAQKLESIGTLAGGIAHDFNNILSPIMIHSEMALHELPFDSPLQFNLKEIYTAGERARDLVKQILTFSRKRETTITKLKISPVLMEVIKLLRPTTPTTIEIIQKIEINDDIIYSDPTQIHQLILNLCTNAVHAMKEKGGVLEISLKDVKIDSDNLRKYSELKAGVYIRLRVKDTGHGMDRETINNIFEPYFTTKGVGEGSGIGLAVAHGIVKDSGGEILVESEVGKGTTFDVLLPKIESDDFALKEEKHTLPRGSESILFVDDEVSAVNAHQAMLESLDYKITTRTSSIEALEAFRNNPQKFDLVITDMTMPNMTGKELVKEMLSIRSDIPIIICTGFSEQIDDDKAKQIGIKAFVMKPIVMHKMANKIREVLDKNVSN